MTKHDYQPGDRVINTITGILCTVKATPEARFEINDGSFVYLDADNDTYPFNNAHHMNVKRQPIEPGCLVRITVPSLRYHGKFSKVETIQDGLAYLSKLDGYFSLEVLARVAEPAPVNAALKQAQQLAQTLAKKHYAEQVIADDLPSVLDQIDNMTAGLVRAQKYEDADILYKAANKINETQQQAIREASDILRHNDPKRVPPVDIAAWLKRNDPDREPQFKRGDLVTWGHGSWNGRIVGDVPSDPSAQVEVIILTNIGGKSPEYIGTFSKPSLDSLRHV